jgi:hypothetical protein
LTFRRPKAIDLDVMDEASGSQAGMRRLIARLTGVGVGAIAELDGFDFVKASGIVNDFLLKPQPTGATS